MPDTVGKMLEGERRIRWECLVLGHEGPVDLKRITEAKGEDFILANHRPRCPTPGCPGRIRFMDRTSMYHRALDTITDRDLEWWEFNKREQQEMREAGFVCVLGKWTRR